MSIIFEEDYGRSKTLTPQWNSSLNQSQNKSQFQPQTREVLREVVKYSPSSYVPNEVQPIVKSQLLTSSQAWNEIKTETNEDEWALFSIEKSELENLKEHEKKELNDLAKIENIKLKNEIPSNQSLQVKQPNTSTDITDLPFELHAEILGFQDDISEFVSLSSSSKVLQSAFGTESMFGKFAMSNLTATMFSIPNIPKPNIQKLRIIDSKIDIISLFVDIGLSTLFPNLQKLYLDSRLCRELEMVDRKTQFKPFPQYLKKLIITNQTNRSISFNARILNKLFEVSTQLISFVLPRNINITEIDKLIYPNTLEEMKVLGNTVLWSNSIGIQLPESLKKLEFPIIQRRPTNLTKLNNLKELTLFGSIENAVINYPKNLEKLTLKCSDFYWVTNITIPITIQHLKLYNFHSVPEFMNINKNILDKLKVLEFENTTEELFHYDTRVEFFDIISKSKIEKLIISNTAPVTIYKEDKIKFPTTLKVLDIRKSTLSDNVDLIRKQISKNVQILFGSKKSNFIDAYYPRFGETDLFDKVPDKLVNDLLTGDSHINYHSFNVVGKGVRLPEIRSIETHPIVECYNSFDDKHKMHHLVCNGFTTELKDKFVDSLCIVDPELVPSDTSGEYNLKLAGKSIPFPDVRRLIFSFGPLSKPYPDSGILASSFNSIFRKTNIEYGGISEIEITGCVFSDFGNIVFPKKIRKIYLIDCRFITNNVSINENQRIERMLISETGIMAKKIDGKFSENLKILPIVEELMLQDVGLLPTFEIQNTFDGKNIYARKTNLLLSGYGKFSDTQRFPIGFEPIIVKQIGSTHSKIVSLNPMKFSKYEYDINEKRDIFYPKRRYFRTDVMRFELNGIPDKNSNLKFVHYLNTQIWNDGFEKMFSNLKILNLIGQGNRFLDINKERNIDLPANLEKLLISDQFGGNDKSLIEDMINKQAYYKPLKSITIVNHKFKNFEGIEFPPNLDELILVNCKNVTKNATFPKKLKLMNMFLDFKMLKLETNLTMEGLALVNTFDKDHQMIPTSFSLPMNLKIFISNNNYKNWTYVKYPDSLIKLDLSGCDFSGQSIKMKLPKNLKILIIREPKSFLVGDLVKFDYPPEFDTIIFSSDKGLSQDEIDSSYEDTKTNLPLEYIKHLDITNENFGDRITQRHIFRRYLLRYGEDQARKIVFNKNLKY
jgi:hypothetical protein